MIKSNIPTVVWVIMIGYLSLAPSSSFPVIHWNMPVRPDKLVHFILYFILFVLLFRGIIIQNEHHFKSIQTICLVVISCILYGTLMETLQPMMNNGRTFQYSDMLANSIGVISGLIIYKLILIKFRLFNGYSQQND